MIVSQTPVPGLTGRSYTIDWDDDTTTSFTAWCDDEGNEYLRGVSGILGDQTPTPAGWVWQFCKDTGKQLLDVIAWCNPGPTLATPPPPPEP